MGGKQFRKSKGFTLVELIAVVAIISMIAVYITIEINQSADDAKVGLATSFLASNIPSAISSYRAQNMSSCRNMTTTAGSTTNNVTSILTARGISPNSAWDIPWSANYDDSARTITVLYTLFNSTSATAYATTIATNLTNNVTQIASATSAANVLTVVYNCF